MLIGAFAIVVGGGISAGLILPHMLKAPAGTPGASATPRGAPSKPAVAASWTAACQALDLADAAEWSQAADAWGQAASEASTQEKGVADATTAQASFGTLAKDALAVAQLSSPDEAWKYPATATTQDKAYYITINNGPGGQYNQDLTSASAFLSGCGGSVDPGFTPPSACSAVSSGQNAQWTEATTEWTDAKSQATHDQLDGAASSFDLLATDTTLLAAAGAGADAVSRYHSDLVAAQSHLKGC